MSDDEQAAQHGGPAPVQAPSTWQTLQLFSLACCCHWGSRPRSESPEHSPRGIADNASHIANDGSVPVTPAASPERSSRSWFRLPWSRSSPRGSDGRPFHPGRGYERLPLTFTQASNLDDDGASDAAPPDTQRLGGESAGQAPSVSSVGGLTRSRMGSRMSLGNRSFEETARGASADPVPPQAVLPEAFLEKVALLSRLAAVEAALEPAPDASGNAWLLRLSGPLKSDYAYRHGSAAHDLVTAEGLLAHSAKHAFLYDEAGAPLTPIAAMDLLEDTIMPVVADAVRRRSADPDAPVIVAVEIVGLPLGEGSANTAAQRRQDTTASLDDAEIARRKALRRDVTVKEILPMVAREFAEDYTPADVKQRAAIFIGTLLDSASSLYLSALAVSDCSFASPTEFGRFLTAPWVPRATRSSSGTWMPGLASIAVRNCGVGTPHLSVLVKELEKAVSDTELPSVLVAERLVLLGQFDAKPLHALLGLIADVFPSAEDDEGEPQDLPSDGLTELVVPDRLAAEVRGHRLAERIRRLNGKPLAHDGPRR